MKRAFLLFLIGGMAYLGAQERKLSPMLVMGPLDISAVEVEALGRGDALLDFPFLDMSALEPEAGMPLEWRPGERHLWQVSADPSFTARSDWQVAYCALYLEANRWLEVQLAVEGSPPLRLYLDGRKQKVEPGEKRASASLTLETGKHLLVGVLLLHADSETTWTPRWLLTGAGSLPADALALSTQPDHRVGITQVLGMRQVTRLFPSPDGELAAVFLAQQCLGEKSARTWMEVLRTGDGKLLFSSPAISAHGFGWMKDSRSFAYARAHGEQTDLCRYSLDDHATREIATGIENLADCWWSADGRLAVYSQESKETPPEPGYKAVHEISERSQFPERRHSLTLLSLSSGVRHRIANDKENYSDVLISPDGSKILLSKRKPNAVLRPYEVTVYALLDTATRRKEKLLEEPWLTGVTWAPDSQRLLFVGGPSAFQGIGSTAKEGVIPNDFDGQLFLFDLASRKAQPLTRDFKPSVQAAFWSPADRLIYLSATDEEFSRIYRCWPEKRKFQRLEAPVDAVEALAYSQRKRALFWGSGPSSPPKLYLLDLPSFSVKLLADYNRDLFARVRWGRTERLLLRLSPQKSIVGTLYLPPDFQQTRKYPCIVYYYGGTTPVGREYGGRYPKEWYAANGYAVLVLQLSGAVGFGQERSAAHVNDWGEITSAEVVDAVREFLPTHPYIDGQRLGAMGASYGGFLTQYLATSTDIFAAFISHAGISSLASYWGVGDWGYTYSAVASADSFPWNRKDLYVGHSPLYRAERVTRPLLLLHGEADNNVPPGESYQMYAALRLLGKEVALVTFSGQQHFILEQEKRIRWMQTIMAWFDRWLKGEPEWWNSLYPEEKKKDNG